MIMQILVTVLLILLNEVHSQEIVIKNVTIKKRITDYGSYDIGGIDGITEYIDSFNNNKKYNLIATNWNVTVDIFDHKFFVYNESDNNKITSSLPWIVSDNNMSAYTFTFKTFYHLKQMILCYAIHILMSMIQMKIKFHVKYYLIKIHHGQTIL